MRKKSYHETIGTKTSLGNSKGFFHFPKKVFPFSSHSKNHFKYKFLLVSIFLEGKARDMSKVIFFSLTDGLKMLNIDNGKKIREKLRNVSQFYAELTDFIRVSETLPIKIVIFPLKHKL